MKNPSETSEDRHTASRLSRRGFLGSSAALGLGALAYNPPFVTPARAAPQKGGVLRAALVGGESTNTLDPALFASQVPLTFGRCWAEQLLEMSPDGSLEPRLAESYEPADQARKWVFKIRKNVTFHNGKTLTPQDIVETYQRHSSPEATSAALALVEGFETIEADGDNVVITLREPNVDLPFLLTDFHLMI